MMKRMLCFFCALCLLPFMAAAESDIPDGLYTIGVSSSSRMFRVVRCVLEVLDGQSTAVLTLSGDGYGYIYPGSAEEATAASQDIWIPCVKDWDDACTYALPLDRLDEEISVAGYSNRYQKWYDRTLVFFSNTLAPYNRVAPDGVYTGVLSSDTALDGLSCRLTVKEGRMQLSLDTENGYEMELPSLDKRLPIELNDSVSGWICLPAQTLAPYRITVADGVYTASPVTDSALLRFTGCTLRVENGKMTAVLKTANSSFDFFFSGSAKEAADCEADWITGIPSADGGCTYVMEINSLDQPLALATHSAKKNMWYDRTLTISSDSLVKEGE